MSRDVARGSVVAMASTVASTPARDARLHPARRSGWRSAVRWFGYLCLVGASFFGGYVAWLLWGTGLETKAAQDELRETITRSIEDPERSEPPPPGTRAVPGSAYAIIRIPSIGLDYVVVEGTDYTSLKKGPGHYPDTADPWDRTGRVGIAGHRTTYLAPFYDLDRVSTGDEIQLLTRYGRFRYEVTKTSVIPSAGSGIVLEQTERRTLVLTTCHPRFSSAERLIVEADLVEDPELAQAA
jgi:sortase A